MTGGSVAVQLRYLFTAYFADGSRIDQTAEDVSKILAGKSAYYDVVQRQAQIPVVRFEITGDGHVYAVSLVDGRFEVDGTAAVENLPGDAKVEGDDPIGEAQYSLVYFRRNTRSFTVDGSNPPKPLSHDIRFFIGWQVTPPGGVALQRMLSVS